MNIQVGDVVYVKYTNNTHHVISVDTTLGFAELDNGDIIDGDPLDLSQFSLIGMVTKSVVSDDIPDFSTPISLECPHEYKTYIGLTQVYDYCVKCDVKK